MVRLFVFLAAAQLVLVVLALISCLAADRVRAMSRVLWVLVILLLPLLGPLAYFLWGRPVPTSGEGLVRRPRRPASPDDDPDFLRSMDTEQSRRDRETLAQWEAELRARELEPEPEPEPERPEPGPRGRDEVRDGDEKGPRPPASGV
jgi:Phospholipase_D-nuclease N-terminal